MSKKFHFVSLNDDILPQGEALIPADGSAARYGTGCFETFRADSGKIFKFSEHIRRLNRGIQYLSGGSIIPVDAKKILGQVHKLLEVNDLLTKSSRVRIQFLLNENSGYEPEGNPIHYLFITASELLADSKSLSLASVDTKVIPSTSRPVDLKLSNMLHYRNAWREARGKGADDAILLTQDGFLAETSIANIFWKIGNTIYTPDQSCDILPGVMRNSLIDLLAGINELNVEEGRFKPDDLKTAETVWVTNSIREIQFVNSVNDLNYDTDSEFCLTLKNWFKDYKKEHLS